MPQIARVARGPRGTPTDFSSFLRARATEARVPPRRTEQRTPRRICRVLRMMKTNINWAGGGTGGSGVDPFFSRLDARTRLGPAAFPHDFYDFPTFEAKEEILLRWAETKQYISVSNTAEKSRSGRGLPTFVVRVPNIQPQYLFSVPDLPCATVTSHNVAQSVHTHTHTARVLGAP